MYGQRDIYGRGEATSGYYTNRYDPDKLSFNLCRAVVNTAQAHIGATRPKPKFQTNDANWTLARKAQKCEQAVNAVFYDQKYHKLSSQAFVDASVCSIGALKVYGKNGKVHIERVFPGELLVDVREGYYGTPANLYQVKLVDKYVLKELYPKKVWEIESSTDTDLGLQLFQWLGHDSTTEQALVMEAWHLPNSKGQGGRRVICVKNGVLLSEPWTRDHFPFSVYRWETRQAGYYGMGIVEELRIHQRTLNYIDTRIRDMMHANSRSTLVVPRGSNTNLTHIDNDPRTILQIASTGERPFLWTANAVPSEWWQERENTIKSAFSQVGVNRMQLSGEKPPGIEAAVALRELNDQGSKRFRIKIQEFEQFAIDTAKLVIHELRSMAENGDLKPIKAKSKTRTKTLLEDIDWKEVALDETEYRLEVQSASSLPDSTPGRIQTVQDWYQAGFINQQEAKALLDFPDLEAYKNLDLASYEIILDSIESIIEEGVYVFPEPTDDLDLAIKLATQSYNKYRLRNAPTERLELLLQYIDDVKHWQEQAMQGANEMQQLAAGMTPALTGMTRQLPGGGGGPMGAARMLQAGQAMRPGPGPGQQPPGGPVPPPQPPG